jgi:Ca2+-binding RTX toxin-like protein
MAIFKITPTTSVFTTVPGDNAFDLDTPSADTLIVDPGAFLINPTISGNGAVLAATGAWTVTVNGSIFSQFGAGIRLDAGNPAVSAINIGVGGSVHGSDGIVLDSSAVINNAGTIVSPSVGGEFGILIRNGGTHTIINSGEITSFGGLAIEVTGTSNNTVKNSGTINGFIALSSGNDTVTNSGFVDDVALGAGNNRLTNSGVMGTVNGSFSSSATVSNSGFISAVIVGNGTNHLTNSGFFGGGNFDGSSFFGQSGNDTVRNSNSMGGAVHLGNGNNTLVNSGTINGLVDSGEDKDILINSGTIRDDAHFNDLVQLGQGDDIVINSGKIVGSVDGGSGADTLTNFAVVGDVMKSGIIFGTISLGAGDDKFFGGNNGETVQDGNGADIVNLNGFNDTYIATGNTGADGIDIVRGGAGVDTYNASAATNDVRINLDSVAHDSPFSPGAGLVAANTATGTDISGTAKDAIFGFENARGGAGNDVIHGSAAGNTLLGGGGHDLLVGFGGNDTLDGGVGFDVLVGGRGKDQLTGGSDADLFGYAALSDSGITAANRDVIADFQQGIDLISLGLIDADNTNAAGTNDAFNFIGTNTPFTGTAGQLHAFWSAISQIIEGDVNGDAKADFSIEIADPTHAITLTSASFIL